MAGTYSMCQLPLELDIANIPGHTCTYHVCVTHKLSTFGKNT